MIAITSCAAFMPINLYHRTSSQHELLSLPMWGMPREAKTSQKLRNAPFWVSYWNTILLCCAWRYIDSPMNGQGTDTKGASHGTECPCDERESRTCEPPSTRNKIRIQFQSEIITPVFRPRTLEKSSVGETHVENIPRCQKLLLIFFSLALFILGLVFHILGIVRYWFVETRVVHLGPLLLCLVLAFCFPSAQRAC